MPGIEPIVTTRFVSSTVCAMAGGKPERFESVTHAETIADRAIREGQERGEFDDLPGHGLPIPDLDTERPAGWWAARWIEAEHRTMATEELRAQSSAERNAALQLDDVSELRVTLDALNTRIRRHNREASRREHQVELIDIHEAIGLWLQLRRARRAQQRGWGLFGR